MRLDVYLVNKKIFSTRTKASQAINRGEIFVNGKNILKNSFEVDEKKENDIKRVYIEDFVSIGGFKLSKAIKDFNINVTNLVCLDIGASTGGFTDCLIQNGAKMVYAVDLNDGLLSEKLKNNSKVYPLIKNAKDLSKNDFNNKIDFISADLSFISETVILPVISNLIEKGKNAVVLIKPQFEMDKKIKFKNGIIKDEKLINFAVEKIKNEGIKNGLIPKNITSAPNSEDKNKEFLLLLEKI